MIDTLEIKNFKSIRHLKLDCKRINVFIGEPNTGKSNILESLGLLSFAYYARQENNAHRYMRYENTSNLFYDQSLDNTIRIDWDASWLDFRFSDGRFQGECRDNGSQIATLAGDYLQLTMTSHATELMAPFKFYRFDVAEQFERPESDFLLPPSGHNLVSLLLSQKELRSLANDLFSNTGLRLGVRPHEHKIEVIKQLEDVIISYPYTLLSDTLQRLIFYMAAMISNMNSVLVFEEPESNVFPYYTKYLAESMALDEAGNQYFISTHNPYFLLPIVEKTAIDELRIFLTYFEDYQTKVKALSYQELQRLTEIDVFANIETFLEE